MEGTGRRRHGDAERCPQGDLRGVRIDEFALKAPTRRKSSEDLLVAAHADAKRKLETQLAEKMQALTGGLPLPPGLKLF